MTTLTLSERAFREQLAGSPLTYQEAAQLWAHKLPERLDGFANRIRLACERGEIEAEPVIKEYSRKELKPYKGMFSAVGGYAEEVITWQEITGWRISPEAFAAMPKSLADDLPLFEEAPAVMAWLGMGAGGEVELNSVGDARRTFGEICERAGPPEGAFKAKVLAGMFAANTPGYNLYEALKKTEGPFAHARVWRNRDAGPWLYDAKQVETKLRSMGRWKPGDVTPIRRAVGQR